MKIGTTLLSFSDRPNANGNIFQYDSIDVSKYQERIDNGTALGMLSDEEMTPEIHFHKVSHIVTNLEKTKNGISGTIEILDTPKGRIAKNLLDAGLLTSSLRSFGTVDSDGKVHVEEIISFDLTLASSSLVAFNPDDYRNRRFSLSIKGEISRI